MFFNVQTVDSSINLITCTNCGKHTHFLPKSLFFICFCKSLIILNHENEPLSGCPVPNENHAYNCVTMGLKEWEMNN